MRVITLLAMTAVVAPVVAFAQSATAPPAPAWSGSFSAYTYFVGDGDDYVQPTVAADRGGLHLEARFNYEDRDTGSAWLGYTFSVGETVTFEITPMIGAVFGNTDGIAPGYKASLGWRRLALDSETEYVFDAGDSSDRFLYTWSELSLSPADWWRLGLVVQRTRVYQSERDVQRGFFAGFSYKRADVTGYVFNPDDAAPTVVLGVTLGF